MSLIPFGFWAASGGVAGAYDLLETTTLATAASSVTFSSIDQSYSHLQVRWVAKNTGSATSNIGLTINGVTSNYFTHRLYGDGSSVTSAASTSAPNNNIVNGSSLSTTANAFGAGVLDILSYSNTTTNKTLRMLYGSKDTNQTIALQSGSVASTAAVTNFEFSVSAGLFAVGTRFSIYGIKGA